MTRPPKEVTDAELAVLEVLWEKRAATVRELADILYPGGGISQTATVQKLCERLLGKDLISRDGTVRPATFCALVDRQDLIGRHLKTVADKLCAGSLSPLLTQLVKNADLDPEELQELRKLVDRLDEKGKPGRGRTKK